MPGERGAILYTVIESCRRRGIDPYAYLRDVLTRLPNMTNHQIPEVTPAAWAKARLGQDPSPTATTSRIINVVAHTLRHLRLLLQSSVKRCLMHRLRTHYRSSDRKDSV